MLKRYLNNFATFINSLTCSVCGKENRIFYQSELVCPSCKGLQIKEKSIVLKELNDELVENLHDFSALISNCRYSQTLSSVLKLRERAAEKLTKIPNDEEAAKIWITCLYILANLPKKPKFNGDVTPNEILAAASSVIGTMSSITLCTQDKIVYLENGEKYETEIQLLYQLPDDVYDKILQKLGAQFISDTRHILEQMMKALMIRHLDIIDSETLSRNLRASFPKYLLPYKDLKEMEELVNVAYGTSFYVAEQLGSRFSSSQGILQISLSNFVDLKGQITKGLSTSASDIFSPPELNNEGVNLALHIFIKDDENNSVYMTYHSLVLLAKICHKYVLDMNEYQKDIGEAPEDWIFDLIRGHLETMTPIGNRDLHRFKLGGNAGEIDAAGYNDKKIILVESKFRETLTISELEIELNKFEKTINNFNQRKVRYGFSKNQEVIPLFYNPYPPFPTFGKTGIILIPTITSLIWYLQSNFPQKDFKFVKTNDSIRNFLNGDSGERLYMTDLSNFLDVEIDTYRIQDVQIDDIIENEVVAYAFGPIGSAFPFTFDIDDDCLTKIKMNGVKKGSVIRACTYNLNGNWTLIQLVDFRIIYLEKQLDPDRILTELNPKQYEEFLAYYNTGREAESLLNIASANNMNLKKYIGWAENKGYNINIAIGRMIAMSLVPRQKFIQCECGNVMSIPERIYEKVKKQFSSSLKCKDCDPSLYGKILTFAHQKKAALLFDRD